MNVAQFGLESMADRWQQAWALPKFQAPPTDFDAQLLHDLEVPTEMPDMVGQSSVSLISIMLTMSLRGGYEQRVAENAEHVRVLEPVVYAFLESAPTTVQDRAFDIQLNLALVRHLSAPELPEAQYLSALVVRFLEKQLGKKKIGNLHPIIQNQARMAAHVALLANNNELFTRILQHVTPALLKTSPSWTLYHSIGAYLSQSAERSIGDALQSESCAPLFRNLLRLHRFPVMQQELGPEGSLGVPLMLGNYLYVWAFVRYFRPDLQRDLNWGTFRALMTG